ncbi:FeMo cofactor biosynthesis protein NifB [uncultured archaeon]|nr:FeMo cofactor biosynthesis protein NifB [uncultured archaeon]
MKGKIVYRFETPAYPGSIVYINLISNYSCNNDCIFCGRPRKKEDLGKPNIYEKKANSSLYLKKSPSVEEIMRKLKKEIRPNDQEIAIIGLGEPLIYLPKVLMLIKNIKKKYPKIIIRVDTNGLVDCMYKNSAEKLKEAGLDQIRISLNAINKKEYDDLCQPKFKDAFKRLIQFIKDSQRLKMATYVSFVIDFQDKKIKSRKKEDYIKFAIYLGIKKENIILRKYMPI